MSLLNTTGWNRIRYNFYAPFYDVVGRRLMAGRERSMHLLSPWPGDKLLLVGAGTGLDLELIPEGVHITAIDISQRMLGQAARRAENLGRPIELVVGDVQKMPFADGQFDHIVLHLILAVVPDPVACIREAARVLRPGGRVAIFDKFLPDGKKPSPLRRIAGVFSDAFVTNINRPLLPLIEQAGLDLVRREPSIWNGFFQVVLAEKPEEYL